METVLITGGSGLVGRKLCQKLIERGFKVNILSTSKQELPGVTTYLWNIGKKELNDKAIMESDYIVHLAGANISDKRWTHKRKKIIVDSRVESIRLIFEAVKKNKKILKGFISASAVGYYGATILSEIYSESTQAANDFLGETCKLWEQEADLFNELGIRVVKIRTGVVLSKKGGALSKMILPFKMGFGSVLGNGKQYLPWIHLVDLCEIYIKAISDVQMKGAYNAVAPDHKTNEEFNRVLAHVLKKPFWFPNIPAWFIKLIFGEMSDILLKGSRVSCDKIITSKYTFKFPVLESALNNLLKDS